jgi:cytidylate kinase
MGIIMISRGSFSAGKEIAEKAARRLGYKCISREDLLRESRDFDVAEIKLIHAFEGAPSFMDRFVHKKAMYIATMQRALLNHLKEDNVLYHGFVFHFFVKDFPEILKVRVISGVEYRIKSHMEREKVSRKKTLRQIQKIDQQRTKWGRILYGIDPANPEYYDMVLQVDRATEEDVVSTICRFAGLEQFQMTPVSLKTLQNLALAAEVKIFLIDIKAGFEVCIDNGFVSLIVEPSAAKKADVAGRLGEIMKRLPDLKGIKIVTAEQPEDKFVCLPEPSLISTKETARTFFTDLG